MSDSVIRVSALTRRFGAKTALASVSLSLSAGRVYGLVGANGAGKTTLFKHILGLLRAEKHGFLVVYPAGSGAPRSWNVDREGGLPRDVRFISELIDRLEATYNIDPARIYADGLSNGGGMAFVLSCTLSDRIAAVGMVAAAQSLEWSWCTDPRPVPMIAFHGTADAVTPYLGGRSPVFPDPLLLPSIPTWTANWARRNRCGTNPAESVIAPDVTRREYTSCAGDAAVVLYTIQGGGHSWPGGKPVPEWLAGPTSNGVDATSTMWAFFREHPLPRKVQGR